MQTSTVKWFDTKKGYGFIHHPEDGEDVFVHYSNIKSDEDFKTLQSDQRVQFEMNDGPKGLHALEVVALDDEPAAEEGTEEFDLSEVDPTAQVDPSPSGESSSDLSV
ncbi:MAG: cold-shock protein [Salinibacter sp.]